MYKIIINIIIYIILSILINKIFSKKKSSSNLKKYITYISLMAISSVIYFYLKEFENNFFIISIFLNISILTIYILIFKKYKDDKSIKLKNILYYILVGLTLSFILEISLFNYRHYESLSFKETTLKTNLNNEKITVEDDSFKVSKSGKYSFEYLNINQKINNIKIDIINIKEESKPLNILIEATDEANEVYLKLPEIKVLHKVTRSNYHKLSLSGKSEKIKLTMYLDKNTSYKIKDIKINTIVPFYFEIIRIIIITIIIFMFYIFRPKSQIYNINFLEYKNKIIPITLLILGQIVLSTFIFYTNVDYRFDKYQHHHQYHYLAESLSKGKVSLDLPVSEKLKKLSNPYDYNLRKANNVKKDKDFYWDHAYYKGKYYVYFGVLPVLTAHLPYYLITGEELLNHRVFYVVGILTIISFTYLIYQIIKRWFKNTSLGTFLIVTIFLFNASGLLMTFKNHDLYNLPIIYSLLLSSTGLALWISSYNKEKNNLNIIKTTLGSMCLALIAACRPQFLLSSFFIFPLFFSYFFKEEKMNKRKILELISLIIPYIIVAIPLMYYNYIRFGSIMDFGANYNLTTNDMTKRGFSFERIFTGIYYYLFDIPNIIPVFPYLSLEPVQTNYLGNTIQEPMVGGFLSCNIICIISFLAFKMKNSFKEKKLFYISVLSIIFAFIIIIADTQMAGILSRYLLDFSWLFVLSTIIVLLTLNEKYQSKNLFKKIIVILVAFSCLLAILTSINEGTYKFINSNSTLYQYLKYLLNFWL